MLRAIKVKVYPNKTQEQTLNKVLGCYRFVYNHMLAYKQESYKTDKTNLKLTELSKYFHGTLLKDENYAWLKVQNTKVMSQAIRQMLTAYDKFFKEHKGFPKFKTKKDDQSALFPIDAISKGNTFDKFTITLTQSLKNLHFRCSDNYHSLLHQYKNGIRSATLSKTKSGKYFLSILIDIDAKEYKKFEHTGCDVGIDLGVKDFVITSDGEVFENKHFLKSEEIKLKKLQRQLSKKQKGSNNRNKQRIRLAKVHECISNKKNTYIHSVVNELLKLYDTIYMENLNIQGMLKNHKLAKAISEVGFCRFKSVLSYKAAQNGKNVEFIDRFYPSSKTCSNCGNVYSNLSVSEREWTCCKCGTHHDRDVNAAMNILSEGKRLARSA